MQQFQLRFPSGRFRERVQFYMHLAFITKQWKEAVRFRIIPCYPQSQYRKETLEALGYSFIETWDKKKKLGYFSAEGQKMPLVADTFYREKWQQALSFLEYLKLLPRSICPGSQIKTGLMLFRDQPG